MFEYYRIATAAIRSNKLRSSLTLLGIVIGVWAITSMQAVVSGFDQAMENELSVLGSETFVIQKFPAIMVGSGWWRYARRRDLTYADALYLQERAANVRSVTAVVERYGQTVKYKGKKTSPNVKLVGSMAGYVVINPQEVAS